MVTEKNLVGWKLQLSICIDLANLAVLITHSTVAFAYLDHLIIGIFKQQGTSSTQ
jgi:hypothetical protein